ncbi:MAG: hypothetical protein RL088_1085 [Verrucomicrobiota bacterium]|jgi:SAM-dependent methyltransferase
MSNAANHFACRICGGTEGGSYKVREMMMGLREEFDYFECASCGCLQIKNIPEDIAKYYPANYRFTFTPPEDKDSALTKFMKRKLARHFFGEPNLLGALLAQKYKRGSLPPGVDRIGNRLRVDSRILEVGCGVGRHLWHLKERGFRNLLGIDPFIAGDEDHSPDFKIRKCFIDEVQGHFDFIMLQYSFEHLPNPAEILRSIRRLLAPGGISLIRIPVSGCYAWKKYGVNWVALDAPRHLFLHTEKSLAIIAAAAGLEVFDRMCDGNAFQIWGSEQFQQDIPLMDPRSPYKSEKPTLFSAEQMASFEARAKELNATGEGDSFSFYLRAK